MRYPAVYQETILTRHRMWISVVTRIGGIIEIGISDKQFTSEMNNVHPTTRNTPVRSAYSTLFSTDTSFSSIRLSCHVISLPTCTIGADRPTRNNSLLFIGYSTDLLNLELPDRYPSLNKRNLTIRLTMFAEIILRE